MSPDDNKAFKKSKSHESLREEGKVGLRHLARRAWNPNRELQRFSIPNYIWLQTMAFAIKEINQEQSFLPNITLGFLVSDTCLSMRRAILGTLMILTGNDVPIVNYRCQHKEPLAAIIADSSSARSISVARILGLFRYPQVCYFSSSPLLKDKLQFPSFLRTVPSDDVQAMGIARLVVHFGWTWVGLLSSDNDLGDIGSFIVKEEFQKLGVCVAFHESIPLVTSALKVNAIVEVVKKSSANVIIIYSNEPYRNPVITALSRENLTGKVWIPISIGSILLKHNTQEVEDMLNGALGFEMQERWIPGLKEFLLKVHPSSLPNNMFANYFWEEAFGCQWPQHDTSMNQSDGNLKMEAFCSGVEDLRMFKNPSFDNPTSRINYNVYNAIYMVAHALEDIRLCKPGQGPFINKSCADLWTMTPWQVHHYMKKVRFWNKFGDDIAFDGSSDLYNIINLQKHPNITTKSVKVPKSVCSESCTPGYWKAVKPDRPVCCFDCVPCSEGQISNETDSRTCEQCSSEEWPNRQRTACFPKTIEFLSFQKPLGATLAGTAMTSSILTASVLCIFFKHRHTPIVKANNRGLSYILLGALMLTFLCSLLFFGEPQTMTCFLRQISFGIVFALCISCILSKTILVVIAFNATKPGSNMRKWLSSCVPMVTVSVFTSLQVLISATWLLLCPPFPEKNMTIRMGTIVLRCNECSEVVLWCLLGYMVVLAFASFLVAFLVRNLPDSFNEAKWITFSMLVFLSVWLTFVPSYLSTDGKYVDAVEVFAIITSSAGIFVCIFIPKCYIIMTKPELNTRQQLMRKETLRN
ncbi:extracellular calcium-sensing receptor-like [Pleurodeles waltl]|uniref:extracellular calcium-sensing receptor-like n=1 Tax=Pleurodeles waltl TaxID=8319 RepID=UPI0037098DD8